MSFSDNLRKIREKHSLTQKQLARLLHISQQSVSKYENGEREPRIGYLLEFCNTLDVDITDLIVTDAGRLTSENCLGNYNYSEDQLSRIREYAEFIRGVRDL